MTSPGWLIFLFIKKSIFSKYWLVPSCQALQRTHFAAIKVFQPKQGEYFLKHKRHKVVQHWNGHRGIVSRLNDLFSPHRKAGHTIWIFLFCVPSQCCKSLKTTRISLSPDSEISGSPRYCNAESHGIQSCPRWWSAEILTSWKTLQQVFISYYCRRMIIEIWPSMLYSMTPAWTFAWIWNVSHSILYDSGMWRQIWPEFHGSHSSLSGHEAHRSVARHRP